MGEASDWGLQNKRDKQAHSQGTVCRPDPQSVIITCAVVLGRGKKNKSKNKGPRACLSQMSGQKRHTLVPVLARGWG